MTVQLAQLRSRTVVGVAAKLRVALHLEGEGAAVRLVRSAYRDLREFGSGGFRQKSR